MVRFAYVLLAALAAKASAPLYQASFDTPNNGWTAVRGSAAPDASVRSLPLSLTIGKRYELSGWVRTENLTVRDLDRSPITTGAALTMASMPFDVHSASVAGTQDWTRLTLRF